MGKSAPYPPGSILWAYTLDRNGCNGKVRPLVAIPPPPIDLNSPICCLAISTDPENQLTDPAVEVPWDAATGEVTGLYQKSRAVVLWHVQVAYADVKECTGRTTKSNLNEILSAREIALNFPVKH
jgi:hypothetical protein